MTRLICGKESVSPFVATTQPTSFFEGQPVDFNLFISFL